MSATIACWNWQNPQEADLSGVRNERESLGQLRLSAREFGRTLSGPALSAYADWIAAEARTHDIGFTLFLNPACARLSRVRSPRAAEGEVWLPDAAATLMLAGMEHTTIHQQMLAIAAAFTGFSARQLFARFQIPQPAGQVLTDLGLGDNVPLGFGAEELTRRFLQAFRWDFYRAAARLRAQLFRQFVAAGLKPGQMVAVVDLASNAHLPTLAARLLTGLLDVDVRAYTFILSETAAATAEKARFPFASFASELRLPQPMLDMAGQRAGLFDLALHGSIHQAGEGAAFDAGMDEGVSLFAKEKRSDASASDLAIPLFARLCAARPDFPGPLPQGRAKPDPRSAA